MEACCGAFHMYYSYRAAFDKIQELPNSVMWFSRKRASKVHLSRLHLKGKKRKKNPLKQHDTPKGTNINKDSS